MNKFIFRILTSLSLFWLLWWVISVQAAATEFLRTDANWKTFSFMSDWTVNYKAIWAPSWEGSFSWNLQNTTSDSDDTILPSSASYSDGTIQLVGDKLIIFWWSERTNWYYPRSLGYLYTVNTTTNQFECNYQTNFNRFKGWKILEHNWYYYIFGWELYKDSNTSRYRGRSYSNKVMKFTADSSNCSIKYHDLWEYMHSAEAIPDEEWNLVRENWDVVVKWIVKAWAKSNSNDHEYVLGKYAWFNVLTDTPSFYAQNNDRAWTAFFKLWDKIIYRTSQYYNHNNNEVRWTSGYEYFDPETGTRSPALYIFNEWREAPLHWSFATLGNTIYYVWGRSYMPYDPWYSRLWGIRYLTDWGLEGTFTNSDKGSLTPNFWPWITQADFEADTVYSNNTVCSDWSDKMVVGNRAGLFMYTKSTNMYEELSGFWTYENRTNYFDNNATSSNAKDTLNCSYEWNGKFAFLNFNDNTIKKVFDINTLSSEVLPQNPKQLYKYSKYKVEHEWVVYTTDFVTENYTDFNSTWSVSFSLISKTKANRIPAIAWISMNENYVNIINESSYDFNLTWILDEDDDQTLTLEYSLNAWVSWNNLKSYSSPVSQNDTVSINLTSLSEGTNTVLFRITDGEAYSPSYTATVEKDTIKPELTENVSIEEFTNDTTPTLQVTSTENWNISLNWSCSTNLSSFVVGNNVVTLNVMADWEYSDCYFTITDVAGNISDQMTLTTFTVDTIAPDLPTSFLLNSGAEFTNSNLLNVSVSHGNESDVYKWCIYEWSSTPAIESSSCSLIKPSTYNLID